jgi:hypothetical protein
LARLTLHDWLAPVIEIVQLVVETHEDVSHWRQGVVTGDTTTRTA